MAYVAQFGNIKKAGHITHKSRSPRRRLYEPEARAGLFIIMTNACLTENSLNLTTFVNGGWRDLRLDLAKTILFLYGH